MVVEEVEVSRDFQKSPNNPKDIKDDGDGKASSANNDNASVHNKDSDITVPNPKKISETILLFNVLNSTYELAGGIIRSINTIYLVENGGLSISQAFVVNASFSFGTLLFEVPTGVVADVKGRRFSYLLSSIVQAIGTLMFLAPLFMDVSSDIDKGDTSDADQTQADILYVIFVLATILMGLGYTFATGALEAWFVDALKAYGHDEEKLDVTMAKASGWTMLSMLSGIGAGAALALWSLEATYVARAALLVLNLLIASIFLKDAGFTPETESNMWGELKLISKASLHYGFQNKESRLLIANGAFSQGVLIWAFYIWQVYILALGNTDNPAYSGLYQILILMGFVASSILAERLLRLFSLRSTYITVFQTLAVLSFLMMGVYPELGAPGNVWVVGAFGIFGAFFTGAKTPIRQAYLHRIIPTDQRATIVSVDSLLTSLVATIAQTGLGYMSDALVPNDLVKSIGRAHMAAAAITSLAVVASLALHFVGGDVNRIVHNDDHSQHKKGVKTSDEEGGIDEKQGDESIFQSEHGTEELTTEELK